MVVYVHNTLEFQRMVLEGSRNQLVVVDFYADWCGPCRMVAPAFEALAQKYTQVHFVKVNVDQAQEAAQQCSVRAMPTFQLFQNGRKVDEVVGANIAALERSIVAFAKPPAFSGSGYTLGSGGTDTAGVASPAAPSSKERPASSLPDAHTMTLSSQVRSTESAPLTANLGHTEETKLALVQKTLLEELETMGFPRNRAIKACIATQNASLQEAMEWIFAHDEEPHVDDLEPTLDVQIIDMQEGPTPKTREEKEQWAKKMREEVRKRREIEEKRLAIEQEKNRLRSGKEIAEAKRQAEEEQRRRLVQERFREQREKQLERERLRKLLEEDRQRRLEMRRGPNAPNPADEKPALETEAKPSTEATKPLTKITRLQLRLPDGSSLEADFTNDTLLREVADYVQRQCPGLGKHITLMGAYPRRKFHEQEMDHLTLQDAQLYPRGALFILRS
jgi:thioredoxin